MGESGSVQVGVLSAVMPHEPRHVVVRVDVPDRPDDRCGTLTTPGGVKDGRLQPGGGFLKGTGRSGEFLPRSVVHARQCLTFLHHGHDHMLHHRFAV